MPRSHFALAIALLYLETATALPSPPVVELLGDDVADGLRMFRVEMNPNKRFALLQKLAPTGDPRVVVALVDAANNKYGDDLDCEAADLIWWYYASPDAAQHRRCGGGEVGHPPPGQGYRAWWAVNKADIRRRAARLER